MRLIITRRPGVDPNFLVFCILVVFKLSVFFFFFVIFKRNRRELKEGEKERRKSACKSDWSFSDQIVFGGFD